MNYNFNEKITFQDMHDAWHKSLKANIETSDEEFLKHIGLTKDVRHRKEDEWGKLKEGVFHMNASLPFLMHFFAQRCKPRCGWSEKTQQLCQKYAAAYEERLKTFDNMTPNTVPIEHTYPIIFVVSGRYSNIIKQVNDKGEYRISETFETNTFPSLNKNAPLPIYGIITSTEYIETLRAWLKNNGLYHIQIFDYDEVTHPLQTTQTAAGKQRPNRAPTPKIKKPIAKRRR